MIRHERRSELRSLRGAARDLAERGWNSESGVSHMLLNCVEEGMRKHGHRVPELVIAVDPVPAMALSYVCRVIYRQNDPGTNRRRYKMIGKYGGGHSHLQ